MKTVSLILVVLLSFSIAGFAAGTAPPTSAESTASVASIQPTAQNFTGQFIPFLLHIILQYQICPIRADLAVRASLYHKCARPSTEHNTPGGSNIDFQLPTQTQTVERVTPSMPYSIRKHKTRTANPNDIQK
ncbi:hypothetical protein AMJ86_02835 [bacterium SM23_57]|nr:MAG: hypothetical protein AMJ86_02835 [bacterium SM23_57]